MKNRVIHTWNKKGKINVIYDSDRGRSFVELDYPWYFAIEKKNFELAKELLKSSKLICQVGLDETYPNYVKVFAEDVFTDEHTQRKEDAVLFLEEGGIQTYEGDLLKDRRWYVDKEVEIGTSFKKLYFDIETDDTIQNIEIGRDRILSFAGIDSDGKVKYFVLERMTDTAEKKLLKQIMDHLSKYDIVLGWNSSKFDALYIKSRMRKFEMFSELYSWKKFAHFDLLKRFRHIFRFDSHIKTFNLNYVSNHFLGKGKIQVPTKVIDLYKKDKEKLKEYNIEDAKLVKELDEKLGVSNMMIKQSQWCGVPPSQFGLYSIIDSYILRIAHQNGKFGRTSLKAIKERNNWNERGNVNPDETTTEKSKYTGAIVLDPKPGLYGKVYTFDFKSLYPSMMRTSNIGYDTLEYVKSNDLIVNPGTYLIPRSSGELKPTYFKKTPSVITLAITNLLDKRTEYKNLKLKMIEDRKNKGPKWESVVSDEIIVKELSNSTYGIMGLDYGRYYSVDIAESITLFGQWCINFAKKFFEGMGYLVIAGDTDSVMVSTGTEIDVKELLIQFHLDLKEELTNFNIDESFIQLNFDKEYNSFINVTKKNYVGHVVNIEGKKTDDIYARGLEFIKKNTFSFAAEKQKELIDMILQTNPVREVIEAWVYQTKEEFYRKDFTKEELTITQKVGKSLDSYKKTPPLHSRLAQVLEKKTGKIHIGSEIEYIITDNKEKSKKIEGILAKDFDGTYSKDYYWENKTLPLLTRIIDVVFPNPTVEKTEEQQIQLSLFTRP